MTDEESAAKGRRTASELEETNAAFDAVRAAFLEAMISTSPENTDKILRLHIAAQTVDAVREALIQTVINGRHAEHAMAARDAVAQAGLTRN